jgi:hypothetical protein
VVGTVQAPSAALAGAWYCPLSRQGHPALIFTRCKPGVLRFTQVREREVELASQQLQAGGPVALVYTAAPAFQSPQCFVYVFQTISASHDS